MGQVTKVKGKRRVFEGEFCACAHRIEYWYDIDGLKVDDEMGEQLEEAAEERARECIAEDYVEGELNFVHNGERELRGWWSIKRD